jgi:TPR repeat protein
MGRWITLFTWMYTTDFVGRGHQGRDIAFWPQDCAEQRHNACRTLVAIEQNDCSAGDTAACMHVAGAVSRGALPGDDPLLALRGFAQACEFGNPDGCARLSERLDPQSIDQLRAACEGADARACHILGSINLMGLADLLRSDDGVYRNPGRAEALELKACRLGLTEACRN